MKKLIHQIFRFGIVGGLAFIIDYGVLLLLTESLQINYLLSSAVSFSISTVFNYILSVKWVYDVSGSHSTKTTLPVFVLMSSIGLGLTQGIMYLGTERLGIHYLVTKIFATVIVMIYNFISRKLLLEGKCNDT